jgi:hypothetical protein
MENRPAMGLNGGSLIICAAGLMAFAAQPAAPQHPSGDAAGAAVRRPYDIKTFGMFRKIILEGDFTAKVQLAAAMAGHPTTGVGALADARGEITIYDGKLIVSNGKPGAHPAAGSEAAALLVVGAAGDWQSVPVERDVAPTEIEAYLAATAKAHGLDPEKSFPFQITGTLVSYLMHVNAAPTGGPHGMGLPVAIALDSRGDEIAGRVAGIYVSADLEGIATHGGERTHAHWVSPDGTSTAHLDRWGLKAGAVLLLPKP